MPVDHWFRRLRRHAVFPVLLYLPLSQAVRDEYPISHFSMYSNPTDRPLKIHSLTDGEGGLISVLPHTGITPSQVSKMFGGYLKDGLKADEKVARREGRAVSEELLEPAAGRTVLEVLRKQSMQRAKRMHLNGVIQLREAQVGFGKEGFVETNRVLATLPAVTKP